MATPRSSWKGFLKLSLVTVPVKAYTANETASEIRLNQLHADCNHRIRHQKTCPEHGEVTTEEIVSGYEYAKDQYVRIDLEELSVLRTQSDRGIHIHGFIAADAIDPMYQAGRTYYLLPDGAVGQKPYALLYQAMADENACALAQVVIAGREQLVVVRPVADVLVMSVLHHDARVRKPEAFHDELVAQQLKEEELALTKTLLRATRIENLDYAAYKDTYVDKLTKLIEAKVAGQELVRVPDAEEPKILNLMDALKRSVAQAQSGAGPPAAAAEAHGESEAAAKSAKKMAPSSGRAATGGSKRKKSSG
jgi:DNA end-binding protein Ku